MSDCTSYTKTKPVGKCGGKIWLGTVSGLTGNESLFVQYFLNGDEVTDIVNPIIQGNDVFLDLTDPYVDYYNPYKTYYIWLTNSNGYYSDNIQITNNGLNDGFIVNFSNAANAYDRLIPC